MDKYAVSKTVYTTNAKTSKMRIWVWITWKKKALLWHNKMLSLRAAVCIFSKSLNSEKIAYFISLVVPQFSLENEHYTISIFECF